MDQKFSKILGLLVIVSMMLALIGCGSKDAGTDKSENSKVVIFVGLGTGTDPEQITMQEELAKEFNNSHEDIKIEFLIVPYRKPGNVCWQ